MLVLGVVLVLGASTLFMALYENRPCTIDPINSFIIILMRDNTQESSPQET